MPPALLLFGLPMWAVILVVLVLLAFIAFAILKRLFKLALIVGAVIVGVWIARMLIG